MMCQGFDYSNNEVGPGKEYENMGKKTGCGTQNVSKPHL